MYYIRVLYSCKEVSAFMLTEPNCSFVLIFKKTEVFGYIFFFQKYVFLFTCL